MEETYYATVKVELVLDNDTDIEESIEGSIEVKSNNDKVIISDYNIKDIT